MEDKNRKPPACQLKEDSVPLDGELVSGKREDKKIIQKSKERRNANVRGDSIFRGRNE